MISRSFYKKRKKVAITLLVVFVFQLSQPAVTYALTSGPAQPESFSFQPVTVSNMVNVSSGDFQYNIPLLEIDGYPVNLNYQGGTGVEDEASWAGLGWNVSIGSVNRQLRGVPDDFSGDDVSVESYTKPKITVGGRMNAKFEFRGLPVRPTLGLSLGIFSDSYTGVGAEIGANAGMSFAFANGGSLTAGMGLGVLSNTSSGVDASPYVSLSLKQDLNSKVTSNAGLSASLGYNTRSGLKGLTLGTSFGVSGNDVIVGIERDANYKITSISVDAVEGSSSYGFSSSISFNTEPISPKINVPYRSTYNSFSIDVGGAAFLGFAGLGATGYKSVREVLNPQIIQKQYGFLYAENGKNDKGAIMDFQREKQSPAIPEIPNLPIPVPTYDLFSFTNQLGSGQFRVYRGGTGAFFDNEAQDVSKVETYGIDLGFGAYFHGGVTHFDQKTINKTAQWKTGNAYIEAGGFQEYDKDNPQYEQAYFKLVGEKNKLHKNYFNQGLSNSDALSVKLNGESALSSFNEAGVNSPQKDLERHSRRTLVSYLTADEASEAALDKKLITYSFLNSDFTALNYNMSSYKSEEARVNSRAKKHHLSEIKVIDEGGKTMVYGMPVYNKLQKEITFAVGKNYVIKDKAVNISVENNKLNHRDKGIDGYYNCETSSPYASSFLLTAILSPDYIDVKRDGITMDDPGTAIKFNYSKINTYKWRTPYPGPDNDASKNNAALNRGLLADDEDDKGNIVYGEKELIYPHSIETKNKIAFFITEDREDALGVLSWMGGRDLSVKQKKLKEIRLYSKHDLSTPIKVVVLDHDYSLCPATPNSSSGKLTLKRVYFKYGNSGKGSEFSYRFDYHNQNYGYMAMDRWGTFRPESQNLNSLTNEEYPYSSQSKLEADENVKAWNLKEIILPSGGKIQVEYESDDYSYVQNKKASTMHLITGFYDTSEQTISNPSSAQLKSIGGLKVSIKEAVPMSRRGTADETAWFRANFMNGNEMLYTKLLVNMKTDNFGDQAIYDYVPAYHKVRKATFSSDGKSVNIFFNNETEAGVSASSLVFPAWQKLKNEYPKFAYPGYKNKVNTGDAGKALKAVVEALANSFRTLSELKENFYKKANRKSYAKEVNMSKSFIRLATYQVDKLGGGHRVKKVKIDDDWKILDGNKSAVYGQIYEYKLEGEQQLSSGVAAYEPAVGNDENSLKQPLKYMQRVKGGINNLFELEEPFGESFYPAASVIYSRVKITQLDRHGNPAPDKMGYEVEEYYTAKDFPVQVKYTPVQRYHYTPKKSYSFFNANSEEYLALSQGYSVVLNDMHGKLKAKRIFNNSDFEIASTNYEYASQSKGDGTFELDNKFTTINANGSINTDVTLGREAEFYTDFREQESSNTGRSINVGFDLIPGFFGIPIPIPHKPTDKNSEYKLFRAVSSIKIIQNFGMLKATVNKVDGASIRTEYLAFDELTSEPIVSRAQNEFEDYIYTMKLPAYWTYSKMGGAYQNANMLLKSLTINSSGFISNTWSNYLKQGDQLISAGGIRYWVVENSNGQKYLINDLGHKLEDTTSFDAKLIKSSFQNKLQEAALTMVTATNPLLKANLFSNVNQTDLKVLSATAQTYDEKWVNDVDCMQKTIKYENLDYNFLFFKPTLSSAAYNSYGSEGVNIYDDNYLLINTVANHRLRKRLTDCGIWSSMGTENKYIGYEAEFVVPEDKTYYIGISGDDFYSLRIDDNIGGIQSQTGSWTTWNLHPYYLTAGKHKISVYGANSAGVNNPASLGVEVYNNTLTELANSNTPINLIFSSGSLANNNDIQSFIYENTGWKYRFKYKTTLNPFIAGMLGNWRPYESYNYLVDREQIQETNVPVQRNSGFYNSYTPFWFRTNNIWDKQGVSSNSLWKLVNTVTQYDRYGQELETKDALGKYSSASFSFNGELPAAVASNAMNREIYYNSFEDTKYLYDYTISCNLLFNRFLPLQNYIRYISHTGLTAYLLNGNNPSWILSKAAVHAKVHKTSPYYTFNNMGEFILNPDMDIYPKVFEPKTGKYLISAWIKDYNENGNNVLINKEVNLEGKINATGYPLTNFSFNLKAIVEGWKLVEAVIDFSQTEQFQLELLAKVGKDILIDDVRICPYDSFMKTYVYSHRNFKLSATLDENNLATFYEYDDQGSLVRVKKETERGIVTLKESRSSYKKSN